MPEIEGAQTLAFTVDDFVQEWAKFTDTFLVDSTCEYGFKTILLLLINYIDNTNKNNMELFCGVADMLGEGLPLSYLFITTEAGAPPLTKQTALIAWMSAIKGLGIDPGFTLSDKDQSEINALKDVWPGAKHQLCLWHMLRALKRRLSKNDNPNLYSASQAHSAFQEIDKSFVPLGQMSVNERVRTWFSYCIGLIWLCSVWPPLLLRSRSHGFVFMSMGRQLYPRQAPKSR